MSRIDFHQYNHHKLRTLFEKNLKQSPLAYLKTEHCQNIAKKTSLWKQLDKSLSAEKNIPHISYTLLREFKRSGNRSLHQDADEHRIQAFRRHSIGVWLNHPKADITFLQDLIWAICDEHTWVMPAHAQCVIDLGSIGTMLRLAEMVHLIGDQLEPEIIERVHQRIQERGLGLYYQSSCRDGWHTTANNWNLVCNGGMIRLALLELSDPLEQASIVHQALNNMSYALDAFTDDGGCDEGQGYWSYGVGEFALAALALSQKSKGKINIMSSDKVQRICAYPLAVHVQKDQFAPYSDTAQHHLDKLPALLINQFHTMPQLYQLCARDEKGLLSFKGGSGMHHALGLYSGEPIKGENPPSDSHLEDLRFAKCRSQSGPQQVTVLAIAAHNNLSHNHNDTGNVCVFRDGQFYIDDLGAPIYTRDTFTDKRYDSLFCNAYGHNLPIINDQAQIQGEQYKGTMSTSGFNQETDKHISMDLTKSYPNGTVSRFHRSITVGYDKHTIQWHDHFEFGRKPKSLIENFVTYLPVKVAANKQSVSIGSGKQTMTLSTDCKGNFESIRCTEESKQGRSGKIITRILFRPSELSTKMDIYFQM